MDTIIQLYAAFRDSGLKQVTFGRGYADVTLTSDDELRRLAAERNVTIRTVVVAERSWDQFETYLDDLPLYVTGPHRVAQTEAA